MDIFIAGAGPIGLLLLHALASEGCRITAGELSAARRDKAMSYGAANAIDTSSSFDAVSEICPDGFDIAVDATGLPAVMEQLVPLVKKGGEILYFGVPDEGDEIRIPAFRMFSYGLSFHSSYTSVNNSEEALQLLSSGNVNGAGLLTHTVPLEEFEEGINLVKNAAESGALKVAIRP
jgi:threonine dehydrogenase-like Zn-dependent dehydrogenase